MAVAVLDEIMQKISLRDWQRLWVVRALDELEALKSGAPGNPSARVNWVTNLRHGRQHPVVMAEAALALSAGGSVSFAELEYALRDQPGALTSWYISGILRLKEFGTVTSSEYAAVYGEGGLFAALLPKE